MIFNRRPINGVYCRRRPSLSYHRRLPLKKISVSRKLQQLENKGIYDEVLSTGVMQGTGCWSDYIRLPDLGLGRQSRKSDRLKVWSINMDGTASFLMVDEDGMEDCIPPSIVADSIFGIYVVQDRQPDPECKPLFVDVFGDVGGLNGSRMDCHVRRECASRFSILMRMKQVVSCKGNVDLVSIKRYMKFRNRNSLFVTFKGEEGTYKNVKENALLIYVCWESNTPRKWVCNLNSRMVYYH